MPILADYRSQIAPRKSANTNSKKAQFFNACCSLTLCFSSSSPPSSSSSKLPALDQQQQQQQQPQQQQQLLVMPEEDSGPGSDTLTKQDDDSPLSSPTRADIKQRLSEEQEVFIYDGRDAVRRGNRKSLYITPNTTVISALEGALRAFTLFDDPAKYEFRLLNQDMVPEATAIDPTITLFCQLPSPSTPSQSSPPVSGADFQQPNSSSSFPEASHLLVKKRDAEAGFVTFYADWIE